MTSLDQVIMMELLEHWTDCNFHRSKLDHLKIK